MAVFEIKKSGKWQKVRATSILALANWSTINKVEDWRMVGMQSRSEMEANKLLPVVI